MDRGFEAERYPSALWTPERLMEQSHWLMHIPFAFALTDLFRPERFVELGSHRGDSYFAFCQAVEKLSLKTECYAVDTWAGDLHTGGYPDEVFSSVEAYNNLKYSRFSTLLRCLFDEALDRFEDGSVDLLHIDGTHTYEAVRHDFESWLPKMSRRGIILLHDVAEFQDDFGVWRFWEEVRKEYPSFTFSFEHGLGVLAVGDDLPEAARLFFKDDAHAPETVHYFSMLGERVREMAGARDENGTVAPRNSPGEPFAGGNDESTLQQTVRLLAFYLPQFYPTPENDSWWGRGFTEWTNVVQAKPLYATHDQPRIPADLGFYDLRLAEAREAQASLAREHGISGFCYYHYWFKGRRILERPSSEMLLSGEPDFPFCFCWANHSWTAHWNDGIADRFIEQSYSDKDDLEHIRWLLEAFKDSRYIKINGRPLLLVYIVQDLPDAKRTFDLWREEARKAGVAEPYICKVEAMGDFDDPGESGCDAAVEFPPHPTETRAKTLTGTDDLYSKNHVYSYKELAGTYINREKPSFRVFPTVMPSFDNTPRHRDGGASLFLGSTPELYGGWLEASIEKALANPPEERLVFVNAWNEWGEGNHLEPDIKNGRAYLESMRKALEKSGVKPGTAQTTGRSPVKGWSPTVENRYADLLAKHALLQQEMLERLRVEEDLIMPPRVKKEYETSRQRISDLQDVVRLRNEENKQLIRWLREINGASQNLFSSRSWRVANILGAAARRLGRQPHLVTSARRIRKVAKEFRAWSKNRRARNAGANKPPV
ncbi:glycoside hydrolase family 99-like domain-containing protein [Rubrobacter indicoceani]|uniref:glycoside hydrolase family 99-like domain-containing protein n=1 Tax=Rubrobacter indicoceani TaxID=2051957 RepID=UPI000E5ADD60|nr:glycoside hydrolase family 99-like domain-containing protein [Rubrobacter indicoceani]